MPENNKNIFSEEYVSGSENTSAENNPQQEYRSESIIDSQYYKTAKPRRQVIRGKITNDTN